MMAKLRFTDEVEVVKTCSDFLFWTGDDPCLISVTEEGKEIVWVAYSGTNKEEVLGWLERSEGCTTFHALPLVKDQEALQRVRNIEIWPYAGWWVETYESFMQEMDELANELADEPREQ
jgi:hypothetical protein